MSEWNDTLMKLEALKLYGMHEALSQQIFIPHENSVSSLALTAKAC